MKTTHLEEKQKLLLDRRENLIGRFDQAAHGLDVRMLLVLLAPVLAWCVVSR